MPAIAYLILLTKVLSSGRRSRHLTSSARTACFPNMASSVAKSSMALPSLSLYLGPSRFDRGTCWQGCGQACNSCFTFVVAICPTAWPERTSPFMQHPPMSPVGDLLTPKLRITFPCIHPSPGHSDSPQTLTVRWQSGQPMDCFRLEDSWNPIHYGDGFGAAGEGVRFMAGAYWGAPRRFPVCPTRLGQQPQPATGASPKAIVYRWA